MNAEPNRGEYRYERKFLIDELDAPAVILAVKRHPAMFSQIYPPRFINNIYLDSPMLDSYSDNLAGAPDRVKARIRWYHDLFQEIPAPTLEFKIKKGLMGTKLSYDLPGFSFDRSFSRRSFQELLGNSTLPADIRGYLSSSEPVLVNRYRRWYFATPDKSFRVTVDSGLSFYHISKFSNSFRYRQEDHRAIVVELKYRKEFDPLASRISSGFPFRMTRSSKYAQGIEWIYL